MKQIVMGMLAVGLFALSACNEEVAATAAAPGEKNLFSNWIYQDGSTTVAIDFRNVSFGSQAYSLYIAGGGACICMLNLSGTQSSGTMVLASCFYDSLGQGGADPGCTLFDGTSTYTKTADTLTFCKSGASTCYSYK